MKPLRDNLKKARAQRHAKILCSKWRVPGHITAQLLWVHGDNTVNPEESFVDEVAGRTWNLKVT